MQPTQINDLARDVAGLVELPARFANITLVLNCPRGCPPSRPPRWSCSKL
ncbi:hypothetical protein DFAR_4010006 [Desulfarculales bacterium]